MPGFRDFLKKNIFDVELIGKPLSKVQKIWRDTSAEVYHRRRGWLADVAVNNDKQVVSDEVVIPADRAQNKGRITTGERTLTFLGMPFFYVKNGGIDGFREAIENTARWKQQDLFAINLVRAIVVFPFNLLFIVPRFLVNVLKLATEYFPRYAAHFTQRLLIGAIQALGKKNANFVFAIAALIVLVPLHIAFKLAYIVGRAITSPADSLYAAWQTGKELAGEGVGGTIVSLLFAAVSLAFTLAAYTFLFPLAVQLIVTYAPSVIATFVQSVVTFLAQTPFANVASTLGPAINPVLQAAGVAISEVLGMATLGVIAGYVATLGTGIAVLFEELEKIFPVFSEWWRRPSPSSSDERIAFTVDDDAERSADDANQQKNSQGQFWAAASRSQDGNAPANGVNPNDDEGNANDKRDSTLAPVNRNRGSVG